MAVTDLTENLSLPERVWLMDTTLRDGEQTQGVSFSAAEKLNIAQALLEQLHVDRIEVASARVSQGEQEAVRAINEWAAEHGFLERVEVLGFVDHGRSVDWILEAGGRVINLLTKGSEKHCHEQLGKTLEAHVADIRKTVAYARERDVRVNVYLEDWSNGYRDSRDYVFELLRQIGELEIEHFMLPDTLGVMSPAEVHASFRDMREQFPELTFDFHPHNDYGLATANCLAAVEAGVAHLHCTMNCLGERAGNVSLAELAVVLHDQLGVKTSIDESHLSAVSKIVERFSGKWVAANMPILGSDVFTQTAGIHADGDVKGGLYETRLSPGRFDRKRSYALGKLSGKASVVKNIEELGISLTEESLQKVLKRVVQLGDSKQVITPDDLPFIITDVLERSEYQHARLLSCDIRSSLEGDSLVDLSLSLNDRHYQEQGSGNGGYAAFIDALTRIMAQVDFTMPELLDYTVRIPRGGKPGALTECTITWAGQPRNLRTRGVHANQVLAAVFATLRMVNTHMHKGQQQEEG